MRDTSAAGIRFRSKNPWYNLWVGARRRCEDTGHKTWKYCSGKGIKFRLTMHECELIFNRDGGHWMDTPSLDRIDATKDYSWDNCRVIEKAINERLPHEPELAKEWSD